MIEVLISLNDTEYAKQLNDFIDSKKLFSVWNIVSKQTMMDLLEKDIIKDNNIRVVITDAENKGIIDSTNIPYDCCFIYMCEDLGFNITKSNEVKILKTINFDNFIIYITMFEKLFSIVNGKDIIQNNMLLRHNKLKNHLTDKLQELYEDAINILSSREYIVIKGNKLTGKTYFSKTLTKDNLYIIVDETTTDIEARIFGDIFNVKKEYNVISIPNIYIIIDNFDKLSDKLQMRIMSAIKYKIYNKNNDNKQLGVKANFILTCTNETRAIKKLDAIITLPDINDYSYTQKAKVILDVIGETKIKGITKAAIYYIHNYDYSLYGLEHLYDIANYIKKNIGDDNDIKIKHLPIWIKQKNSDAYIGSSDLREIYDKEIFYLSDVEKLVIKGAFKKCLFKKEETARLLGITVNTLNNKLKAYNIKAEDLMEE